MLGKSKETALRRFMSMERRMKGDSNLAQEYKRFMHEYELVRQRSKNAKREADK